MRVAAIVGVAALLLLALGPAPGAGESDATALRQCKTLNPAPVQVRCTLLVGTGHLGVVGAGFAHTPCVGAMGVGAGDQACYVGTMKMELTWAGGVWTKTCNQVVAPTGALQDNCSSSGVKPTAGKSFAFICQSHHLSTQNPPSLLVAGGAGPVGCWITISI